MGGHRRRNALTGEWVLVSPDRLNRPWKGAQSTPEDSDLKLSYDPTCYLCPGNERVGGNVNPGYQSTFVFDNDYPALGKDQSHAEADIDPLFQAIPEQGVCRVVCFSPHHSATLSHLSEVDLQNLVEVWVDESRHLGERFPNGSVQIFENKGELMGCSNPHPHCQIWAQESVTSTLASELEHCKGYLEQHGERLLVDYLAKELEADERVVCSNDSFVVLVPYWATWPFETLVLPKRHVTHLYELSTAEQSDFGAILKRLSNRYDNLFGVSFPYSSGIHQGPWSGEYDDSFTLHMHFFPPLLRSAEIRKFLVGYEMLGEPQRDLTPEQAAKTLRALPES